MEADESVDFDFFDTPRKENTNSQHSPGKLISMSTKPPQNVDKQNPVVTVEKSPRISEGNKTSGNKRYSRPDDTFKSGKEVHYSDDSSSESDTQSDTPRVNRAPAKHGNSLGTNNKDKNNSGNYRNNDSHSSDSSSAYSVTDDSSDDSPYPSPKREKGRSTIEVKMPRSVPEAWSTDGGKHKVAYDKAKDRHISNKQSTKDRYESIDDRPRGNRHAYRDKSESESDNDSSPERDRNSSSKNYTNGRPKSSYVRNENRSRRTVKSVSSTHSNNSDITDVSPLESPEVSPRMVRKRYYDSHDSDEKENGDVQYEISSRSPEGGAHIQLKDDQIDLSILMKCMADIDREKQQRLKSNARRVMFAPPVANEKRKQNYSFTVNRARLIERENQRLLKQIMRQVHHGSEAQQADPGSATRKQAHNPKRATEPVIQRLTPSAVNRQREQRRIETDNMSILNRLQRIQPTRGMARQEQIDEFDRTASYGVPSCVLAAERRRHSSMSQTSDMGQQRSRPSSAKSNMSTTVSTGRRSRPSSAKSNASLVSNASVRSRRSNVSTRSNASLRSNLSLRSGRTVMKDSRPSWDDRFAFS